MLGIVGLQWPEDTDCTQFPDENSDNQTCLTPDEDVEGNSYKYIKQEIKDLTRFPKSLIFFSHTSSLNYNI